MTPEEFLRLFPLRSPALAWFLGAGASASARLPTAWDLIWRFKQAIYCTTAKVSRKTCDDLGNEAVRVRIQRYLDAAGKYPKTDSAEEYASYFEIAYPDPQDRRRFIEAMLLGAKPAFGHHVLAGLMKANKSRLVWTTNFDRLFEDACALIYGSTSALTVSTLDSSAVALRALNEGSWPVLGKLHGDFQSTSLKNTSEELRSQDTALRLALVESCKRFGLIVAGYSGRDASVMAALEEALAAPESFPAGLFWITKSGTLVYERVTELLEAARRRGVQAHLIETETFDELMGDLAQQFDDLPLETSEHIKQRRSRRISDVPLPAPGPGWPVIRMNALPVFHWPKTCRKFTAELGGAKELKELLNAKSAKMAAARSQHGILCFGEDTELQRVFAEHKPTGIGLHTIELHRLRRETNELNLLRNALAQALVGDKVFGQWAGRGFHEIRVVSGSESSQHLSPLRSACGTLCGTVPGTSAQWAEAVNIRLDYKIARLWLLMEPTIWVSKAQDDGERFTCGEFIRERKAKRYNKQSDTLLTAWINVLSPGNGTADVEAFGHLPGVSARFTVGKHTAFSRRNV